MVMKKKRKKKIDMNHTQEGTGHGRRPAGQGKGD
jgi:hypothetical protein